MSVDRFIFSDIFSWGSVCCASFPSLFPTALILGTMFIEVLVGLLIGGLIFFLIQKRKTQHLETEDGWWGVGAPPDGEEDVTIRPFKVSTSDEELEVRVRHSLSHTVFISACTHETDRKTLRHVLLFSGPVQEDRPDTSHSLVGRQPV